MSILDEILAAKRRAVEGACIELATRTVPIRSLKAALSAPTTPTTAPLHAIAEFKRASPSAGPIREGAVASEICALYAEAGASAISVLTDAQFFDGHIDFIAPAREAAGVPILRKDFIVADSQIREAYNAGADAILLIVAALSREELQSLYSTASKLGLECLVEIHNETEAERALEVGARIIGVNHRDLATFTIDLGLTERLAPNVPADAVLVAESGIRSRDDVARVASAGAHAILVGEHLMRAADPGAALTELLSIS